MPWLACYNPEINWKTEEVKMIRCLDECGKQWRLKQGNQGSKNKNKSRSKEGEEREKKKRSIERRKSRKRE